ncbi:DNA methyltransferase [Burkholderia gladioli]|uniref:DNA methyltransferase n=1 Tax=Burkholderia gladioli TaxID=28095 RepID=UPI00163F96B8|nr:site-specific DNA-methyltransferase [Burkholderia gladioli]
MTKTNILTQESLQLAMLDGGSTNVEKYEFAPIKGYPMLNWRGKRPFTSTQYFPAQLKEVHGEEVDGWRNKIFWGDNLQVMSHLLREYRGKFELIYIDPPFDSKAEYKKTISVKGKQATGDQGSFEEKQYADIWTNDEYLQFMYERLVLIRELLAPNGSLFLHCDWHKSHHLRCILDEVFGQKCFRNEIAWCYYGPGSPGMRQFNRKHDTIFWYSMSPTEWIFNASEVRVPHDEKTVGNFKEGLRGSGFIAGDYEMPEGKIPEDHWIFAIAGRYPLDGVKRVGYPTEKPLPLLERIVTACSSKEGLVFDCFMGSGAFQTAALRLGRRFIGADINLGAIQTTTKRLLNVADELRQKPLGSDAKYYAGFELYNVNHYDIFRNPAQAKDLLIEALEVQRLEFSTVFDGEKDGRMVKIMPVNRLATRADLNELIHNFDQKAWQHRHNEHPNRPVEKITLVCMGHEPDLAAQLELAAKPFKIDVEVVDILRDKADLEFKRDSQAKLAIKNGELIIEKFYPMNLLQKLSLQKESVGDWKELVDSVQIDWNYDGAVLQPAVVDNPGKDDLVRGVYKVPEDAGTIRVKITDLLSELWEGSISNGN